MSRNSSARRRQSQVPFNQRPLSAGLREQTAVTQAYNARIPLANTHLQHPHFIAQHGQTRTRSWFHARNNSSGTEISWTSYHGCWRLSVADANLTAGSCMANRSALYNRQGFIIGTISLRGLNGESLTTTHCLTGTCKDRQHI